MNWGVAERTHPAAGSAAPIEARHTEHGELPAEAGGRRQPAGWRWIPDPADGDAPTPSEEHEPELSGTFLRALAWATLHHWG